MKFTGLLLALVVRLLAAPLAAEAQQTGSHASLF
jgi:hypothetical protein